MEKDPDFHQQSELRDPVDFFHVSTGPSLSPDLEQVSLFSALSRRPHQPQQPGAQRGPENTKEGHSDETLVAWPLLVRNLQSFSDQTRHLGAPETLDGQCGVSVSVSPR